MSKLVKSKIIILAVIFAMLLPMSVSAAPGDVEQIKYIYFENTNSEMVIVDYMLAIEAAFNGDSTFYNSIKAYVGMAEANGTKIVLETDTGKILDYQKAMVQNKTRLIDIKDNINYLTVKPYFTQELKVVSGAAAIVAATIPAAPAVTNDDSLNTVSGIAAGMEYNLDGAGYTAYDQATFSTLDFSGNHTLLVRVAASGTSLASPDTVLIFTANALANVEQAELAVSAYETAPIGSLAQITAAEGLKAPADTAAAEVADAALRAAFELRISNRAAVIAAAKAALQEADIAAQAYAEAAVAAFESAPITNIAQINTAAGLKTTAEAKVALVADPTAKAAFTARIAVKYLTMAIAEINLQTYYGSMDQLFTKYQAILGLDLTAYNNLANKVPVQTAMLTPVFTSATEIKSAFNNFVAQQMAVEGSVLGTFNNAATAAEIETAIATHAATLTLGLTEYNALTAAGKNNVHTALLSPVFTSGDEIKTAFVIAVINNTNDAGVKSLLSSNAKLLGLEKISEYTLLSTKSYIEAAVIAAKPIADKTEIVVTAFNSTVLSGYIGQLLPINSVLLGLDLTDYNALTYRNKMPVHDTLMNATLNTVIDLQNTFNTSVATQKAFEASGTAAFNNAPNAPAMATVITTYILGTDLDGYNALANKVPVQEALLVPYFTTFADVVTAFNTAVSNEKAAETAAMSAINNAATAAEMSAAITANAVTLGLNLTDYNALPDADKAAVQAAMIPQTFYSVSALKTAFDAAVASQKAVIAVNTAGTAEMGAVIAANASVLGLNLSDYNLLPAASKDAVHASLTGKAFVDKAAVNTAFETAVSVLIINEITTDTAMGTAISRYRTVLGLNVTDYSTLTTAYRTQVHTALMSPVFTTAAEVKAVFDAAVAAAKEAKAVAAINGATTATISSVITANAAVLGLILTDYNSLTNKTPVHTALIGKGFAAAADVRTAFNSAVAAEKLNEAQTFTPAAYVQTLFNSAVAVQQALEAPLPETLGVELNKIAISITVGTNETLIAAVLPENAPNKDVIWSSDDEMVAVVDITGNVTAVGVGTAVITATTVDGGYTATCTVTVTATVTETIVTTDAITDDAAVADQAAPPVILVTGINVSGQTEATVAVGDTLQMLAEVFPLDATDSSVTWSVTPETGTADIDPITGLLTATGGGTVTVTATADDGSGITGTIDVSITAPQEAD